MDYLLKDKRVLCLIDGEHYPPVTVAAIDDIESKGARIAGAVFIGGTEKVADASRELGDRAEYPLFQLQDPGDSVLELIEKAIVQTSPNIAVDLSDEPVIDYFKRFRIGSLLMRKGVTYSGADFVFTPPRRRKLIAKPSLSIIGTGKRVGKTAVGVYVSRLLKRNSFDPVVVCMGRGGPAQPEVIDPQKIDLTAETLIEVAERGGHAASDYWEDALLAGVVTVGCRRCGGGMAGSPYISNVAAGAEIASGMDKKFVIMEGSGATLPPVMTGGNIVIAGAGQPIENIIRFFGEYRIAISNLAIVTMCEEPVAGPEKVEEVRKGILDINPDIALALTVFRPEPLGEIEGRKIFVATTADKRINPTLSGYLETNYSCDVTGISNSLSNRKVLEKDLEEGLKDADLLLTEIKAASIDIAASKARKAGLDIIFLNNRPELVGGNVEDLESSVLSLARSIGGW